MVNKYTYTYQLNMLLILLFITKLRTRIDIFKLRNLIYLCIYVTHALVFHHCLQCPQLLQTLLYVGLCYNRQHWEVYRITSHILKVIRSYAIYNSWCIFFYCWLIHAFAHIVNVHTFLADLIWELSIFVVKCKGCFEFL